MPKSCTANEPEEDNLGQWLASAYCASRGYMVKKLDKRTEHPRQRRDKISFAKKIHMAGKQIAGLKQDRNLNRPS